MNIGDIAVQNPESRIQRRTAFGDNSFLSIGKKGQTVEGTISTVSDKISINFNGVEVAVSKSAVQNAREGETRQFRIMDVSKDSIVLKEVGKDMDSRTRIMMGTSVSSSSYEAIDFKDSIRVSQAKQQAGENIQVMTGEDYQSLEEEAGALEEYKESTLDRAVERIKEQRQWKQERMAQNREFRQESQENLERIQSMSFLEQKSPAQIAQALEEANLPATETEVARVVSALSMSQTAVNLSDSAKVYLIQNTLPPTIENLYHGQYSGTEGVSSDDTDIVAWQAVLPQAEQILAENGLDSAELAHAKWLFANELPVTVDSIRMLNVLEQIQSSLTPDKALQQMIEAMTAGASPEQATLDDTQFVLARNAIEAFAQVSDEDILTAVAAQESNKELSADGTLPELNLAALRAARDSNRQTQSAVAEDGAGLVGQLVSADAADDQELFRAVTARRQLEEIRLRMTLQSAVRMQVKGIDLEVSGLGRLVQELRDMEDSYYREWYRDVTELRETSSVVGRAAVQNGEAAVSAMQEILEKTADIQNAPAKLLGVSVRQQSLLTVNQLHRAAVSVTVQMQQYQSDYEKVGTQVRTDLGDSIKKAFANVDRLLDDMGLEATEANKRAVRILGYNQMEITEQNIQRIKEYDAEVNNMIDGMKPRIVLEMLRRGKNPLDMTLEEVNGWIEDIRSEQDVDSGERYSRYLWQLEQNHAISREERAGYIGIYRLLNQLEKTEGAAIGAVLETGQEMTLGNLLSAVRSRSRRGMDITVDDSFGALDELRYQNESISRQIETGIAAGQQDGAVTEQESGRYYRRLTEQLLRTITPEGLQQLTDGEIEKILDFSLEQLAEQMKSAGKGPLEQEMYQQKAEQLRTLLQQSEEAASFLDKMNIPATIADLGAAQMLQSGYQPSREIYNRKDVMEREEQEEYEGVLDGLLQNMEDESGLQEQLEKLERYGEEIVERSYEQHELRAKQAEDMNLLRQVIRLNGRLRQRRSYEIPIRTGNTVTAMNVTLEQGTAEAGTVQVSMDDSMNGAGRVSVMLRIVMGEHGAEAKGLVLCDGRDGYEALCRGQEILEERLQAEGLSVKNLSYGLDYCSRFEMAGRLSGQDNGREETGQNSAVQKGDTVQLYRAAKCIVQYIAEMFTAINSEAEAAAGAQQNGGSYAD